MDGADGQIDALQGLRILVVEDEMLVAMFVEGVLIDLGCLVVGPAGRLPQAIRLAAAESIDGALLDLNLDGDEVYSVADKLAERNIPFAFATGHSAVHLKNPYRDRPLIQKPYGVRQIQELLHTWVKIGPG